MVGDGEAAIKMFHVKHFVTEKKFLFHGENRTGSTDKGD